MRWEKKLPARRVEKKKYEVEKKALQILRRVRGDSLQFHGELSFHQKLNGTLPTDPYGSCDRAMRYSGFFGLRSVDPVGDFGGNHPPFSQGFSSLLSFPSLSKSRPSTSPPSSLRRYVELVAPKAPLWAKRAALPHCKPGKLFQKI